MPRKNAGHTKQPSRNPTGRPARYAGTRIQVGYLVTTDARDTAKNLAAFASVPLGEFVETLIRRFGPTCAADLKIEQENHDTDAEPDRGSDAVADGSVGAEAVPDRRA